MFLGGTCNESIWRSILIPNLTIDYFNPVVDDWTPECKAEELKQRKSCNLVLYVITPLMTGVYSIAEVIDDSNKQPNKTVFCIINADTNGSFHTLKFTNGQHRSLEAVGEMVEQNGGTWIKDICDVHKYLNAFGDEI